MRTLRVWLTRLLQAVGVGRRPDDLDAELESHIALHTDDNLRSGMSPEEARRAALLAFGSAQATREELHEQNSAPFAGVMSSTVKQAFRSLSRHPGFAAVVVLTLGIGVGMTAALGGIADSLLFRPPDHVASPEQLVQVSTAGNYPQYEHLSAHSGTLDVTAVTRRSLSLGEGEEATPLETQCVTDTYFQVLGVTPVAGRTFARDEGKAGSTRVAMLAHHIWLREFGGQDELVGRNVHIAGAPHTVIGIAPPGFRGLELTAVDAWVLLPLSPAECSISGLNSLGSTSGSWLTTLGRLRPGVALADAENDVRSLALERLREVTSTPRTFVVAATDARNAAGARDRTLSIWLAAGAGLLLLIAASNVAGLISVRALDRRREVTLRLQLGATASRVFLQLATENLMLTVVASVAAWLVAGWVGTGVRVYLPSVSYDPWFDGRMLVVLAVFLFVGGILSGLIPALQTIRNSSSLPQQQSGATGRGRGLIRDGLLAAQVALTLVLSVGAGLFVHSVVRVKSNVGYDLDRVIAATVDLNRAGIRRQADKQEIFERVLAQLQDTPGIQSAALSSTSPLGTGQFTAVTPSGSPGLGPSRPSMTIVHVTPTYFSTIGTRVVEGREFAAAGPRRATPRRDDERRAGGRIGSLRQTSTEVFYPLGLGPVSSASSHRDSPDWGRPHGDALRGGRYTHGRAKPAVCVGPIARRPREQSGPFLAARRVALRCVWRRRAGALRDRPVRVSLFCSATTHYRNRGAHRAGSGHVAHHHPRARTGPARHRRGLGDRHRRGRVHGGTDQSPAVFRDGNGRACTGGQFTRGGPCRPLWVLVAGYSSESRGPCDGASRRLTIFFLEVSDDL